MAVNFSLSQRKLPDDVREASKNPRAERGRRASRETYEVEASRPALLSWAAPRTQTVRLRASEYRKVTRQLRRDGWAIRSRKIHRNAR